MCWIIVNCYIYLIVFFLNVVFGFKNRLLENFVWYKRMLEIILVGYMRVSLYVDYIFVKYLV